MILRAQRIKNYSLLLMKIEIIIPWYSNSRIEKHYIFLSASYLWYVLFLFVFHEQDV